MSEFSNFTQAISEINRPVFSIITPTCRRLLLLERTLISVMNQTFRDYEHIVIDDANDLETEILVKRFGDKRIIFHQHLSPRGAAGGYNTGIKLSSGKFILFLDDDDEYLPSFLKKMYDHFSNTNPKTGFVWTGISRIEDTDNGEKHLYSKTWPSRFLSREEGLVEATSIGNGYGVCVRKECIDSIGLYDESLVMGHDTDFLFRLAGKFDFETISEVLVKLHQHNSSQLTNERNNFIRLQLREEILHRHLKLLKAFPKLFHVHYRVVANLCYNLKLRQKGRKTLLSIIKNTPFSILNYTDLFTYELVGKDTISFYYGSSLRKVVHLLKGKKQASTF
jgi:glycosyltransferase involved in cell wall biosynthesis